MDGIEKLFKNEVNCIRSPEKIFKILAYKFIDENRSDRIYELFHFCLKCTENKYCEYGITNLFYGPKRISWLYDSILLIVLYKDDQEKFFEILNYLKVSEVIKTLNNAIEDILTHKEEYSIENLSHFDISNIIKTLKCYIGYIFTDEELDEDDVRIFVNDAFDVLSAIKNHNPKMKIISLLTEGKIEEARSVYCQK